MAHGDLQHALVHAVVDGQRDLELRDLDVAHDAGTGNIQQRLILRQIFPGLPQRVFPLGQPLVISLGSRPHLVVIIIVQRGHALGVGGDGVGLVEGVPVVADAGVQQQGEPCQEDQY